MFETDLFNAFTGITKEWIVCCFEAMLILIAIAWDFFSGYHKAKLRGEKRDSNNMKRTVSKFFLYFGSLMIATGLDSVLYVCRLFEFAGVPFLTFIPIFNSLLAMFLLVVELKSIWERAEEKTKKPAEGVIELLQLALKKDDVGDRLREILANLTKEEDKEHG